MSSLTTHRSEYALLRAYEHALASPFALGSLHQPHPIFSLPAADDVLTLHNGNKVFREETTLLGVSSQEQELLASLTSCSPSSFLNIPESFSDDQQTIHDTHFNDIALIAHGLLRAQGTALRTDLFHAFSQASYTFHSALLFATESLMHMHTPAHAPSLIQHTFPHLLHTQEPLILSVRRLKHTELITAITLGAKTHITFLLSCGKETGFAQEFFIRHLNTLHETSFDE